VDSVDNTVTERLSSPDSSPDSAPLNTRKSVDGSPSSGSDTEGDYPQLRGPDLAKAALRAAKEAAGGPTSRKAVRRGTPGGGLRRRRRRWSSAGPDDRDPQPLGRLASRIAVDRGWTDRLAGGQLFGRWDAIVGSEVAEHSRPVSLRDGELVVQAESTAWATQLRLLQRQLLTKIAAGVGKNVVTRLKVHGPSAPSWRHGPRHVPGRGPRDTYG
jgi:predicted nucleic acid-binding Zn ribbon protein